MKLDIHKTRQLLTGLVVLVGLIGGLLLIRHSLELRRQAAETVKYQLVGGSLVIEYSGFPEGVLDVNVRYQDGRTENFHQQFDEPIGSQTITLQLEDQCV